MDVEYWQEFDQWLGNNYPLALGICAGYLVIIFSIQSLMRNRKPFELEGLLFLWNLLLAVFSTVGFYYVFPAHLKVMREKGVHYELSTTEAEWANVWPTFFCLSKVPELIDTLFIVLRKRPLRFLHYYHHVATLLFCWHSWSVGATYGGWFTFMNLFVHSIMYTYYAISALKLRVPNAVRVFITALQITQMFGGLGVLIYAALYLPTDPVNIYFGLTMYLSYVVLFGKLFIDSYIVKPSSSSSSSSKVHSSSKSANKGSAAAKKAKKVE